MDLKSITACLTVLCAFGAFAQNVRECNTNTMQTCRNNIDDVVLGYGNTRKMELEDQCWRVRQNFDCVLWQTSMCMNQNDQEANSDVVQKAWRFLDSFCEKFKNYWTKPCYRTEALKRCESRLPTRSRSVDKVSCRTYLNFRDCAMSAIDNDCNKDDQRLLGVYLMDKGQRRAWKCPKDDTNYKDEPINSPLAADSRDIMYSDISSYYAQCTSRAAEEVKTCGADMEDTQKSARELIEEDAKKDKVCCGMVTYSDCVLKVMRSNCENYDNEARNIVQSAKTRLYYNCDDYTKDLCSDATHLIITNMAFIVLISVSLLASTLVLNVV